MKRVAVEIPYCFPIAYRRARSGKEQYGLIRDRLRAEIQILDETDAPLALSVSYKLEGDQKRVVSVRRAGDAVMTLAGAPFTEQDITPANIQALLDAPPAGRSAVDILLGEGFEARILFPDRAGKGAKTFDIMPNDIEVMTMNGQATAQDRLRESICQIAFVDGVLFRPGPMPVWRLAIGDDLFLRIDFDREGEGAEVPAFRFPLNEVEKAKALHKSSVSLLSLGNPGYNYLNSVKIDFIDPALTPSSDAANPNASFAATWFLKRVGSDASGLNESGGQALVDLMKLRHQADADPMAASALIGEALRSWETPDPLLLDQDNVTLKRLSCSAKVASLAVSLSALAPAPDDDPSLATFSLT